MTIFSSQYRAWWVLALTGAAGFRIGIAGFPTWAIPVETAQVVAGLVQYPPDNPFYIYHTKLWTLVIQVAALLLRAGVSEIALSLALSGLLAMVSFQALGIMTFAFGRSVLAAVALPFIVVATRAAEYGVVYPVFLFGTHHMYGALGLSTFVLALGMIGAGCRRSGAFLFGLAPAIHPSLGIWVGVVAAISVLTDARRTIAEFRSALPYFVAGALVTAISLAVQLIWIYDVPRVDAATTARYVTAFVTIWDDHRHAVHWSQAGVILNVLTLLVSLAWLGARVDLGAARAFLLRAVAASAALSLAFVFITWVPPERLPVTVIMLMPARLLNLDVMLYVPLLFGLLLHRQTVAGAVAGTAFAAALVYVSRDAQLQVLEAAGTGAIVFAVVARIRHAAAPANAVWPVAMARAVAVLIVSGIALTTAMPLLRTSTPASVLRDWTNDPFFAAIAAEREGMVATAGSFQLVQLYTRRPVLIDSGGLDTMMYAPESAPAMERVLRDVYGIDFFNPPRFARGGAVVPHELCRNTWAGFSRDRWREIRHNYRVTQVVTRRNYELDLPIAAANEHFTLYRIPD